MFSENRQLKVFAGTGNLPLAQSVCEKLGIPMGEAAISTFADGEASVSVQESVRGCDVYIIQPTCKPVNDNLMQLLVMIDAMKRASVGRITAVMPYFGYARQDRKTRARDPISAKLVADLITAAGADHVITMDIHANQIQGFFNIPVDNLLGSPLFVDHFTKLIDEKVEKGEKKDDFIVVSPDVGSVTRARKFAEKLDLGLAIVDKRREKANESEVMNIIGNVAGKNVILLDDMVDTAGSLCGAANALVSVGKAKSVYACASHGVLSGPAIDRINESCITKLLFVDTIPFPEGKVCDKIEYVSSAAMFAEAIKRSHDETPVSPLYA